ncbi:MAG TPA: hypothetical protein VNC78_10440 [Actinomycetota bacterium]|nr:hypothetical protein [Actinomycetota bacterium]
MNEDPGKSITDSASSALATGENADDVTRVAILEDLYRSLEADLEQDHHHPPDA